SGWRLRLEKSERHLVIFEVCLGYIDRKRNWYGVSLDITGGIHWKMDSFMNGVGIFLMVVAVCFCISLVVIAGVLWRILVAQRAFRLKREQMRLDLYRK
ncbi:hypothetical protein MLZ76_20675, partial [Escherichia coli]|nr:hypothetical protein [Escherichia coli]